MPRQREGSFRLKRHFLPLGVQLAGVGLLALTALLVQSIRPVLLLVTTWLAVVLVILGVYRHRPRRYVGWVLMSIFVALIAIGNGSFVLDGIVDGSQFIADAATLGGQLAAAAALPQLLRVAADTSAPWEWRVRSRGGWLDIAVLTVVVALVAGELFARGVQHHRLEGMTWAIALAPGVDASLVGVLLWLVFSRARLVPAMALIVVGGFGCLIYDLLITLSGARVTTPGQALQALGIVNMLMFGLAALHPSMTTLGDAQAPRHGRRPSTQLLLLLPCAVLPAALLALRLFTDVIRTSPAVLLAATFVVFLAVAVRAVLALRLSEIRGERDPLTGLLNRRGLARAYARMSLQPTRRGSAPTDVSVRAAMPGATAMLIMMIDLDDFKHVNDRHGHHRGDALLLATARRLRDAVGERGVVARHGGDEFIVLLHPRTDSAANLGHHISTVLAAPVQLGGQTFAMTASIGVAHAHSGDALDDVLADADIAMYAAKGAGKSTSSVFHPQLRTDIVDNLTLSEDLHCLLDGYLLHNPGAFSSSVTDHAPAGTEKTPSEQLRVVYQPVVDLDDGRVVGAEALVRWQHPTRGMVAPDDFLALAEREGLAAQIDEIVLHQALKQLRQWDHDGMPGLTMSVNLGYTSTCDPDLPRGVLRALVTHGVAPERLHLEITEHDALPDDDSVRAALHEVVDAGVVLALDDFGIGYTSLSYLRRYPISVLKLDRSLVTHDDAASATLRAGIAALAVTLGMTTIAEGIEYASQGEHLQQLGIGYGQGYHYSRPLSPEDFTVFYASHRTRLPAPASFDRRGPGFTHEATRF